MVLLGAMLWWLCPSSRVSTSVPGLSLSLQLRGDIPNIRMPGACNTSFMNYTIDMECWSFWIGDFFTTSLGSMKDLSKLVDEGKVTAMSLAAASSLSWDTQWRREP